MAQGDLILINPIIIGIAAGDHCCQSLQFQLSPLEWHFGIKVSSSQMEWCFQGWRYEDIYQTIAGSFVGDDKFTNRKKTPQIIKTNGVMNMPTRKQVDTSTSSKLHWSREAGVGGGQLVLVELGTRYATSVRVKDRLGEKKIEGNGFITRGCTAQSKSGNSRNVFPNKCYFSSTNWMPSSKPLSQYLHLKT